MEYPFQVVAVSDFPRAAIGVVAIDPTVHKWSYTKDVLAFLPEGQQQHWNCNTCRKFFYESINLVVLSDDGANGVIKSLLWDPDNAPLELLDAAGHISEVIAKHGKFKGAFTIDHEVFPLWKEHNVLGKPQHGGWDHLNVKVDPNEIFVVEDISQAAWGSILTNVEGLFGKFMSQPNTATLIAQIEEVLTTKGRGSDKVKVVVQTYEVVKEFIKLAARTTVAKALTLSDTSTRHVLFHLPGSVAGDLLLSVLNQPENIEQFVDTAFKRFDPLAYQRAQRDATEQELAGLLKLVSTDFPGALDWVIATENEVELIQAYDQPTQDVPEETPTDALSALTRLQKSLTPRAIVDQAPVEIGEKVKISWERLLRDVVPKAKSLEFYVASRTRATILMRRKNVELASPLRDASDYSVITTVNPNPTEGFGLKTGWNHVVGTVDGSLVGSPEITVFTIRGDIKADLYKRVPPPLFSESYLPPFFQYRKAFEELLQQAYAEHGTGEYAHILVPAQGNCMLRVTSQANVTTVYDVIDI